MANEYAVRCTMCGTTADVESTSVEQLNSAKYVDTPVHVCEACKARVQFESEHQLK